MTQGNLQELLGQVPTYTTPEEQHPSTGIPHLPNDSEHAYHLIVVCAVFSFLIPSNLYIIHIYQRRARMPESFRHAPRSWCRLQIREWG
jgi:hypothetical protein